MVVIGGMYIPEGVGVFIRPLTNRSNVDNPILVETVVVIAAVFRSLLSWFEILTLFCFWKLLKDIFSCAWQRLVGVASSTERGFVRAAVMVDVWEVLETGLLVMVVEVEEARVAEIEIEAVSFLWTWGVFSRVFWESCLEEWLDWLDRIRASGSSSRGNNLINSKRQMYQEWRLDNLWIEKEWTWRQMKQKFRYHRIEIPFQSPVHVYTTHISFILDAHIKESETFTSKVSR